jgi:two-component system NtrC family sensor kinase
MEERQKGLKTSTERLSLNVAIVGGGDDCKFFLEILYKNPFPYLSLNIKAVCDLDPEAGGVRLAKEMGILTTCKYQDILDMEDLDGVIELTNDRQVLLDLIRRKPDRVWVLEHNIGKLLRSLFMTHQKLQSTEQQVALERAVSELLLHQTHEPIVLLNPDYTILDANEGYLRAVGRSREEAIGKYCYETNYGFTSPCSDWQPEMKCPMLETLQTGERAHVIHEQIVDDGKRAYANLETFPVKNKEGNVVRVIEIRRDITEELPSRWEMRLTELKKNMGKLIQEDRMLSLGKLSASCAHEINNPIQGLLTFGLLMQSILEEKDPGPDELAQFREYLTLMCSELERCGNIVSGLLSFARESTLERKEVDLIEILHSVISLTRHRMELQDISLHLDLSEAPLYVRGDTNQVQQCFLNLIFNAIEATPRGGEISIVAQKEVGDRAQAKVVIQDTGCGIPQGNLDKIFDPFFTTKPEGEGTGLGLSIVYGVVKGHDGRIDVESEQGRGTRFILRFPVWFPGKGGSS